MAATTRLEILTSLGAILFFAEVLAWGTELSFRVAGDPRLTAAGFLVTLYR